MSNTSTYLLQVALGPVQGLIASARRTRDLWFGSELLSELSKAAAYALVDKGTLIFPNATKEKLEPNTSLNVANKIVIELTAGQDPKEAAEAAKEAIQKRLQGYWEVVRDQVEKYIDVKHANAQIEDLIEITWLAVPVESDPKKSKTDFEYSYGKLNRLMAARKSLRDFNAVSWGSHKFKSSLDGERESILSKDTKQDQFSLYGTKKGEHLCAIGLLKRLSKTDGDYLSTSALAAQPWLDKVKADPAGNAALEKYQKVLKDLKITCTDLETSGQQYYETTAWEDFGLSEDDKKKANDARNDFLKSVPKSLGKPSPYYAIFMADGDNMGVRLDACKTADELRTVSGELAEFAEKAKDVIKGNKDNKGNKGQAIYVGGDDVLAFLPLDKALDICKELATEFATCFKNNDLYKDDKGKKLPEPTLSGGLLVAHYLEPFSEVLDQVRDAEKKSKAVGGKNGLCVVVDKRSGSATPVSGKVDALAKELEEFIKLYRTEAIPHGLAYELRDLAMRLENMPELQYYEANRIIKRKNTKAGKLSPKDLETLDEKLKPLLSSSLSDQDKNELLNKLANTLITARVFVEHGKQS